MAQKFLKKGKLDKKTKRVTATKCQPKIRKVNNKTVYGKMVHEEKTKITKTINQNIEEQMMAKAKLNQEQFSLLKTKEEKKKQAKAAKKQN